MNENSNWIKVDDRLPQRGVRVIAIHNGFPYKAELAENGEWLSVPNQWHLYGVTHWTPLPEGPK